MTTLWIICKQNDAKGNTDNYGVLMTEGSKLFFGTGYNRGTFGDEIVYLVPKEDLARLEAKNDNIALLAVRSEEVTSVDADPPYIRTKPNKVKLDNLAYLPVIS